MRMFIKPIRTTTLFVAICLINSAVSAQSTTDLTPYNYSSTKQGNYKNGAVVSAHPLASQAGLIMLKNGGNAVDAAIATQLALAVVYPGAGNLGGGGFMVANLEAFGAVAIDYRERAPGKATRDMYIDKKTGQADLSKSQFAHLASGVPGTVAGLFKSLKYAKLPMKQLIEPAITLAEYGFVITEGEANGLNAYMKKFAKASTVTPVFVRSTPWKAGDTLVQKDLANTLKRIQKNGQDGFYKGQTAKLIVAEMKRGNGIITAKDLASYYAEDRSVVNFLYKGYDIISMPPPSSGGVLLAEMLNMVEPYALQNMGHNSTEAVQLMVETERLAYADRAEHLGDPDYYKVPLKQLMNQSYAKARMDQHFKMGVAGNSELVLAGKPVIESEETTHLSVVDKYGNTVAVTTTLNGGYGSCTVVGGAGFLLNNEMDDFSAQPGVANMYGALGGEANAIVPGKRMLSSMTPTLVFKDGKPIMVVGTPGGTTIITSVYQSIINIIDFKLSAYDAVNLPKFHHQWQPDVVYVEKGFNPKTIEALKAMGYKIEQRGAIGRTELILIKADGSFEAVGDNRGDDSVSGY